MMIKEACILILFFLIFSIKSTKTPAQSFNGSFLMTFSSEKDYSDYPMRWYAHNSSSEKKIAMEVQDEMIVKGVSRRILFDNADSTWTMLIAFNSIKQATRIRVASVFSDTMFQKKIKIIKTKESKILSGYKCRKIITESAGYTTEIWMTEDIKFDMLTIYKLLSHCGMLSDNVKKGDWYKAIGLHGMAIQVMSINKISGDAYTMRISEIKTNDIRPEFMSLTGFRISDIPEGQSCGIAVEEK
jgi:hypothetical protein